MRGTTESTRARAGSRRAALRLVIIDDHALMREGTIQLLEAESDIEVVGDAASAEEAIDLIERLCPDVAVVDVSLPGMSGLELARALVEQRAKTKVLIVSAFDDRAYVAEALDLGAGGYLLKTASSGELVDAVRLVATGAFVLDGAISPRMGIEHRAADPAASPALTNRERQVLELLADGLSNKEIAAALELGLRTVESHVSTLLAKLGVSSRTQATSYAFQRDLIRRKELSG